MKKVLLGSTALAALVVAAAGTASAQEGTPGKISLGLSGYYRNAISWTDSQDFEADGIDGSSEDNFQDFRIRHEGELHWKGETTLDNGLKVGFVTELEIVQAPTQLDKTWMYFEGAWGLLEIGSKGSVYDEAQFGSPESGFGVNGPQFFLYQLAGSSPDGGYSSFAGEDNKINYFTPRFAGFQLGLAYTPNTQGPGVEQESSGLARDDIDGEQSDIISAALTYEQEFSGVSVKAAGGWEHGFLDEDVHDNGFGEQDQDAWFLALNVGYAGFTVGGSYTASDLGTSDGNVQEFYDAGIQYATGPWSVSFNWAHAERNVFPGNDDGSGEDEHDHFELGATYTASPGVKFIGGVQYLWEDNTEQEDAEGFAVAVGTRLDF